MLRSLKMHSTFVEFRGEKLVGTTFASAGEGNVVDLTALIVRSYVQNNTLPATDMPGLIGAVHGALSGLRTAATSVGEAEFEKLTAAAIKRSITPDVLISFIDGKSYKSLKRHLSRHGLDADGYRARYGLPADYPMVAPSYSARRSELARLSGLGEKRRLYPRSAPRDTLGA